jgi:hypothetical protein
MSQQSALVVLPDSFLTSHSPIKIAITILFANFFALTQTMFSKLIEKGVIMRRFPLAVCSILLLGLVASGLWVTRATKPQQADQYMDAAPRGIVQGMTMKDMAQRSAMILAGQCLQTQSTWVGRTLYTEATVSVSDTIKGEQLPTVKILLPGGADPRRRIPVAMTFPGAPVMTKNSNYLLFLRNSETMPGSFSVMGYAQGQFSIFKSADGEEMVASSPARITQMNSAHGVVRGTGQMIRLSEVKKQIQEYLR